MLRVNLQVTHQLNVRPPFLLLFNQMLQYTDGALIGVVERLYFYITLTSNIHMCSNRPSIFAYSEDQSTVCSAYGLVADATKSVFGHTPQGSGNNV